MNHDFVGGSIRGALTQHVSFETMSFMMSRTMPGMHKEKLLLMGWF